MSAIRPARFTLVRVVVVAVALSGMAGCAPPPALTKVELDSAVMSKKHPQLTTQQLSAGCRSCHREQPEIRK